MDFLLVFDASFCMRKAVCDCLSIEICVMLFCRFYHIILGLVRLCKIRFGKVRLKVFFKTFLKDAFPGIIFEKSVLQVHFGYVIFCNRTKLGLFA